MTDWTTFSCKKKLLTVEELLQQIASLHESTNTSPTPPSLIIVDRLESFLCGPGGGSHSGFHPGEQSCAAHLSALLCDTAAFLTQILEQRSTSSGPCRVIASFQSEVNTGQVSSLPANIRTP
uniref:SWIM-type zinc finger 7 associated protein 1 n=1 Tax=Lates calcarifer TaxID=8187 RepID=A0A4W6EBY8_LATCA